MISEQDKKTLAHAYELFNGIRARDGAYVGWSEEWHNTLTENLSALVEKVTGQRAHCNKYLYKKYEELTDD